MTDVKVIAAKASGKLEEAVSALSGEPGVFSTLRGEHQQLRSLMGRLLSTVDDAAGVRDRLDLIQVVRVELVAHARAEEREFYSVMKQYDRTAAFARERAGEHAELEEWLDEMISMPPADPMWMASFQSFVATVDRHFRREEEDLFPLAREILTDAQARQIDQLYREERLKQLTALEQGI